MQKLANDIDDFEKLVTENYLYVDKTKFLDKIVNSNTYYFLSRPRRFGKTLFVDTLEKFYQGKKELFKGLYIYDQDWNWEEYPIIRLDFNRLEHSTTENLKIEMQEFLEDYARQYNLKLNSTLISSKFEELIIKISEKENKRVVLLIDEYDKAIISHLSQDPEEIKIANENQDFLKAVYDNLKPLIKHLELVFITGISKFSKLSIFSTLNNLNELDMNPEFSHMLGYTEEELHHNFEPYFKEFAAEAGLNKEELYAEFKRMYNGFRFSDEDIRVYNPYSIARALAAKKIDNYWFESGTPGFLIELLKNEQYEIPKLAELEVFKSQLKAYDITRLQLIPLLFQTGYLTIKDKLNGDFLRLSYPNQEVETAFSQNLISELSNYEADLSLIRKLRLALNNFDLEAFISNIIYLFESIANINIPTAVSERESFYHTMFYLIAELLADRDLHINSELLTARGRIDMAVESKDKVFIIEFKANQSAEKAVAQIKEKGYADKYKLQDKQIILIGINFSTEKKNISEHLIEKLN
ncbi:MAG: AAA family ATPase [Halanaerobium sp.]